MKNYFDESGLTHFSGAYYHRTFYERRQMIAVINIRYFKSDLQVKYLEFGLAT